MSFEALVRRLFDLSKTGNQTKTGEDSVSKIISDTKQTILSHMERAVVQQLPFLNQVVPQHKKAMVATAVGSQGIFRKGLTLTESLLKTYTNEKQTYEIYELKVDLRQRLYSLLVREMDEMIDLYMIGSSQTMGMGSKTCDTDLCLVVYDPEKHIDMKYEQRDVVLNKLEELKQILEDNQMASKAMVIPALVPILKFTETVTGIEVNININKVVTIRNTYLLYMYSTMDRRVAQLVLLVKIWAEKKGIKSAFNKSLTSYSISLMVIHFLQKGCSPPLLPCLQKESDHLFNEDPTKLRLLPPDVPHLQTNTQDLGQLFANLFEYYATFDFNKVISVRTGHLLDRQEMMGPDSKPPNFLRQWRCHICIEEPFDRTNTSHAVHDCRMYRQIVQEFIDAHISLVNRCFTLWESTRV